MLAEVVLTSSESKRLIGKAVASMEVVKETLKSGLIIIIKGTTNSYVAEEILKKLGLDFAIDQVNEVRGA